MENNENNSELENKSQTEDNLKLERPHIEDEIDFLRVIKNPRRWFGLIYPYFFLIFLTGGIFFVWNMNTAYENNVVPVITDSTNTFTDIAKPVKASASKAVDLNLITKPTPDIINRGKTLFQTNCTSCHGQNGMGDGPAGAALNPKPRNFHSNQGWVNGRKFPDMLKTINKGIPGSGMAAYEYLPNEDKVALIDYIRTLANDFPAVTPAEVQDMDKTYNLSQGSQSGGQIPVSEAVQMETEDAMPRVKSVYEAVSYINNNPDQPEAKLFDRVAADKIKVLSFLSVSNSWTDSVDDFIKTATSSVNVNGFKSDIVNLSRAEWNELYSYLKKLDITKS